MDFLRRGVRETLPQPDVEQLSRKLRQLECLLQSLRWRHSSKDFKVFGNSLAAAQVLDIKGVIR